MNLVTGSKLPIFRHCAWAAREDAVYPKRESSGAANNGTRLHDAFASYIEHKVFPPLTPAQRILADQMRRFWGDRASSAGWRTEVAFALDPVNKTARVLGKDIKRKYIEHGLNPALEIGLTVDYVWVEKDGLPLNGDWKTGYGAHVEPPEDNLQMLAGGAAIALSSGMYEAGCTLEVAQVTEEGVFAKRFHAAKSHLDGALREIAWIFRNRHQAEARAGEHCRFCPALGACPETGRAVQRAAASYSADRKVEVSARAVFTTEFVSKENDVLLVEELSALKKMIGAVEDSLKERSYAGVHLPNGKVWKPVLCRRTSLDTEKVEEYLGDRLKDYQKVTEYEQFKVVKA